MSAIDAEISVVEAAKMLDVSRQRVFDLIAKGFIEKAPSGRLVIAQTVQGYRRSLLSLRSKRTAEKTDTDFRAARSQELQLKIVDRSNKLVDEARAEALQVVDEMAGALRTDLQSVAANATDDIHLRRKIDGLIQGAFAAAARRSGGEGRRLPAAGGNLDAGAGGKPRRMGRAKPRVPAKRRKAGPKRP